MKKFLFSIQSVVVIILLSSFVFADEWFLLEQKNYFISFPKEPQMQTQNLSSKIGELHMIIHTYEGTKDDENFLYGIITTAYPDSLINSSKKEKLTALFRGSIDGAVKQVNGKLLSEKEIELDGFPGREVRVDFQNGLAIITMRLYQVHNEMFILQTIAETSKEKNPSQLKFFNSFKLK